MQWADYEDDETQESEEPIDLEDDIVEFDFLEPLNIYHYIITSHQMFVSLHSEITAHISASDPEMEFIWDMCSTNILEAQNWDECIDDLEMIKDALNEDDVILNLDAISAGSTDDAFESESSGSKLLDLNDMATESLPDFDILNEEALDLGADANDDDPQTFTFTLSSQKQIGSAGFHDTEELGYIRKSEIPPMAPSYRKSLPLYLRLCASRSKNSSMTDEREEWDQVLRRNLPDFPDIDFLSDDHTSLTSRSRTRPPTASRVMIVFDDDSIVDIGSHGYKDVKRDIDVPLDVSPEKIRLSLAEFFSAPSGVGLATATPSHILHQSVCAMLSNTISCKGVLVEFLGRDITIPDMDRFGVEQIIIDITSSAGVWNKQLYKDPKDPRSYHQAAISKYDLAAIFSWYSDSDTSSLLNKAVANCLACEYPSIYRVVPDEIDEDHRIQSDIYGILSSMSVRTLHKLAYKSQLAVAQCGLDILQNYKSEVRGESYVDKSSRLKKHIDSLEPRSLVAFPPIPLSEIKELPATPFKIFVLDHEFISPNPVYDTRAYDCTHDHYTMSDISTFLKFYPCDGRLTHDDAKTICNLLDNSILRSTGMTHKGPSIRSPLTSEPLVKALQEGYSSLAVCQYAEILSDVARAAYEHLPPPGKWASKMIYQNKVALWYRCRDSPNSYKGFRIDWFAVSSFRTHGSIDIKNSKGDNMFLWPRQRMRSCEMDFYQMGPRRLSLVLHSMLEKKRSTRDSTQDILLAFQRLALTLCTSTWAAGQNFITCRFLSATLSSPSSPFDEMGKKLIHPRTFSEVFYLQRLSNVLGSWDTRDKYNNRSAILGLSKHFAQLEAYWMMWVPSEFANAEKNMAECIMDLREEVRLLEHTKDMRVIDLQEQKTLLLKNKLSVDDLSRSVLKSCSLDTDGKLGWSFVGSLASAYALSKIADPYEFDLSHGKKRDSRTMADHLTVRHSARIDHTNTLKKGTVAEMIIDNGLDIYLSTVTSTYRFLYVNIPVFFNHPKLKEHKNREISITDPDSRIALSDAEYICGTYGRRTGIDYLKDTSKNKKFYRRSATTMKKGGTIQSSDATRFGPMMSNMAIAIMCLYLGTRSIHMKWCSIVYARLSFRVMLMPDSIICELEKKMLHDDTRDLALDTSIWMRKCKQYAKDESGKILGYCTSHHMGQGMSHHASSLLHAGAIQLTCDILTGVDYKYLDDDIKIVPNIMVTSDDSTVIVNVSGVSTRIRRRICQQIGRHYLDLYRLLRPITLRMVSVKPNLVKEIISGVKGEFNSQDTGIGFSCPILGFREIISKVVMPTSPSLMSDYLNCHAIAREIALSGQGIASGLLAHSILIDSVEERWKIRDKELKFLSTLDIIPNELIKGCTGIEILSAPETYLDSSIRSKLMSICIEKNATNPDIDPNCRDSVFGPLMHVRVMTSKQHRIALQKIDQASKYYSSIGMTHQSRILDECRMSTLSSARTRNLGRVASKIRHRTVNPPSFLENNFVKGTMIDTTLNWYKVLNNLSELRKLSSEDIERTMAISSKIILGHVHKYDFPSPPVLRKFTKPMIVKPKFILSTYGHTPFGRHAIEHSGAQTVDSIGVNERSLILEFNLKASYRSFHDHILYGHDYVISWHDRTSSALIVSTVSLKDIEQTSVRSPMYHGLFDEPSLSYLRRVTTRAGNKKVLALHTYCNGVATFHAVTNSVSQTVRLNVQIDESEIPYSIEHVSPSDAVTNILVIQGMTQSLTMQDMEPLSSEVDRYLNNDLVMPEMIHDIEWAICCNSMSTVATYGTELIIDGEAAFVYVEPMINCPPSKLKDESKKVYVKSKVISDLSLDGYWYSHINGVCFRAFLKNHFHRDTIWPGSVYGWQMSSTDVPTYHHSSSPSERLKSVIVLDGLESPTQMSEICIEVTGKKFGVISTSGTRKYNKCYGLYDAQAIDHIVNVNDGNRFDTQSFEGFMNINIGTPLRVRRQYSKSQSIDALVSMVRGDSSYSDFM